MDRDTARYGVFLSYAHVDRRWARKLVRRLETWKVPRRLAGTEGAFGPLPRTLGPVFRDRDELSASSELGTTINRALQDSAAMVVICSPTAARSHWVNEEIRTFKALGRGDRIFAFIIDGDPGAGDGPEQCFPPALRFHVGADGRLTDLPSEPIAADAREEGDGPRRAQMRLFAGLLGVGYDDLRQREQHRRNQRLVALTAASVFGMAVTVGLAISARLAQEDAERRRAQAESLIDYLVGDLHKELRTLGRTDVLSSLGDEALKYFSSLSARDLNDDVLARQAQALTQIGEVRIEQGRLADAEDALEEAYARSAELVARHPGDGQLLFDRAQAEFYVGYVFWTQRNLEPAAEWFTRYRDSTRALAALDPGRLEWVRERAYGEYNLAVLSFQREEFERAREIFADQIETLRALRAAGFDPPSVDRDIADGLSWQGSVAESLGELATSEQRFREALDSYQEIVDAHPEDRTLEEELANVTLHLARILGATGQAGEAVDTARQASAIYARMSRLDPGNAVWRSQHYRGRRTLAELAFATADLPEALELYDSLLSEDQENDAEEAVAASDPVRKLPLLIARARSDLREGEAGSGLAAASGAVQLAERAVSKSTGARTSADLALALVVRGRAFQTAGDTVAAAGDFERAYETCRPIAGTSKAWFVLDPCARAAMLAGHPEEQDRMLSDLQASGYVPLWPWPAAR